MKYRPGLTTLCVCFALLCLVAAVLAWLRPVRTVTVPADTAAMDAALEEAASEHARADSAMVRAAWWQAVAETARAERMDIPRQRGRAEHALRSASLDSLHAVLFGPAQ